MITVGRSVGGTVGRSIGEITAVRPLALHLAAQLPPDAHRVHHSPRQLLPSGSAYGTGVCPESGPAAPGRQGGLSSMSPQVEACPGPGSGGQVATSYNRLGQAEVTLGTGQTARLTRTNAHVGKPSTRQTTCCGTRSPSTSTASRTPPGTRPPPKSSRAASSRARPVRCPRRRRQQHRRAHHRLGRVHRRRPGRHVLPRERPLVRAGRPLPRRRGQRPQGVSGSRSRGVGRSHGST